MRDLITAAAYVTCPECEVTGTRTKCLVKLVWNSGVALCNGQKNQKRKMSNALHDRQQFNSLIFIFFFNAWPTKFTTNREQLGIYPGLDQHWCLRSAIHTGWQLKGFQHTQRLWTAVRVSLIVITQTQTSIQSQMDADCSLEHRVKHIQNKKTTSETNFYKLSVRARNSLKTCLCMETEPRP